MSPFDEGDTHMQPSTFLGSESVGRVIADCLNEPVTKFVTQTQGSLINGARNLLSDIGVSVAQPPKFEAEVFMAAARVEDQPKDQEFRSAQCRNYTTEEWPHSSDNNC